LETKILKIEGMTCAACAKSIERVSKKLPGVEQASVNFATEKLNINYDESKVKLSDIQSAVEKAGYKVLVETTSKNLKIEGMTCAACAKNIERVTRKLNGVIDANVNFATEKLAISFEPSLVRTSDIKKAIEKAGYKALEEESNVDTDKEKKEKGEEFTVFYKINIHGGEALESFRIPMNVSSFKFIDKDNLIFSSIYDSTRREFYKLSDSEKDEELKKRKEEKDYEVIDEIPFWMNGSGFTNKKRSRLYAYNLAKEEIRPFSDEFTNVEAYNINKIPKRVYCSVATVHSFRRNY